MSVPRISHERLVLDRLRTDLTRLPDAQIFSGQGAGNRFGIGGWSLTVNRQFQFGDLRVESANATVGVEAESGGGVSNLAKDWPFLLARDRPKRFVLVHLFQVGSEGDYLSHCMLWDFLVERMRADLAARRGLRWPEDWEAALFRYRPGDDLAQVSDYIALQHGKAPLGSRNHEASARTG